MSEFDVERKPRSSTFGKQLTKLKSHEKSLPDKEKVEAENTQFKRDLAEVFGTPKGKKVLDMLQIQYCGKLVSKDHTVTIANAAKREMFDNIRDYIKLIEEQDND